MITVNNSKYRRGSFIGDPNGFVSAPSGTLFKRKLYSYKLVYAGSNQVNYTSHYYEPTQIEYENDSIESIWIKSTPISNLYGWSRIVGTNTPTPTPPNVNVEPTVPSGNYLAEYFSDANLQTKVLTRIETDVNHVGWTPPLTILPNDLYSARWTAIVTPDVTQVYTFRTYSDDGVRLWVNDQLIVDNWTWHGPTYNSGTISLTASQSYPIKLEYFQGNNYSVIRFGWLATDRPYSVIPHGLLSPVKIMTDGTFVIIRDCVDSFSQLPISNNVYSLPSSSGWIHSTNIGYWGNGYGFDNFDGYFTGSISTLSSLHNWAVSSGSVSNINIVPIIENFNGYNIGTYVSDNYIVSSWSI